MAAGTEMKPTATAVLRIERRVAWPGLVSEVAVRDEV